MTPIAEAKDVRSNKRRYQNCTSQFAIAHTTFKAARDLTRQIAAALEEAPLVIDTEEVLYCLCGTRTYSFESTFWRVIQEVAVMTSRLRPGVPGP